MNKRAHAIPVRFWCLRFLLVDHSSRAIGLLADWIQLDSSDADIRLNSELAMKQEIDWACHISLAALIFPFLPKGSLYNTARAVNNAVRSMSFTQVHFITRFPKINSILILILIHSSWSECL